MLYYFELKESNFTVRYITLVLKLSLELRDNPCDVELVFIS